MYSQWQIADTARSVVYTIPTNTLQCGTTLSAGSAAQSPQTALNAELQTAAEAESRDYGVRYRVQCVLQPAGTTVLVVL